MRFLTAGESHGKYLVAILEGFPKGVRIEEGFINKELKRRQAGYGRGKRMNIENDKVEIVGGLRNKITLGSPIALLIKNKDVHIFSQSRDFLSEINTPRPAHADLAGVLKYGETDITNILERASARETAARVAVGAVCKQFLNEFKIEVASFTRSLGKVEVLFNPSSVSQIKKKTSSSLVNCVDKVSEKEILQEIEEAKQDKDTLGGVIEVWAEGVPAGLGSFMHFDRRLDTKLAGYLMSIPAIKGVEIGSGFSYAKTRGSVSHDEIYYSKNKGFYHKTNSSGGIEGGVSTGERIVLRIAMKPISTLGKPLSSVNIKTRKKSPSPGIRSDVCAVAAGGVVAEAMVAIAICESFLEKFSSDTLLEIKRNYSSYLKNLPH